MWRGQSGHRTSTLDDLSDSSPHCISHSQYFRDYGHDIINAPLGGQELIAPERDVLDLRLHASRAYPWLLVGESPLATALDDLETQYNIKNA
jgi:hypothetical protein